MTLHYMLNQESMLPLGQDCNAPPPSHTGRPPTQLQMPSQLQMQLTPSHMPPPPSRPPPSHHPPSPWARHGTMRTIRCVTSDRRPMPGYEPGVMPSSILGERM